MRKTIKIRLKYTITVLVLAIVIIMNWLKIPLQDNFVKLIEFIIGMITGGFAVKKITDIFKK